MGRQKNKTRSVGLLYRPIRFAYNCLAYSTRFKVQINNKKQKEILSLQLYYTYNHKIYSAENASIIIKNSVILLLALAVEYMYSFQEVLTSLIKRKGDMDCLIPIGQSRSKI